MNQRLLYDILQRNGKEVWEFPITQGIRKGCKLAYQRKKLNEEKSKAVKDKNEKDLTRNEFKR